MSDADEPLVTPSAVARRGRRFSIIWIIPVLAVAIGGWLAWDTLSKQGPTITISFTTAEGLQAGQSQLKYKDIVLGTVKSLKLTPDHARVVVTIATTRQAEPLLTDNTVFWVVKPRLFAGSISGLETVLSGAYIGMMPQRDGGTPKRDFVGLEDPPILQADVPGHLFLLQTTRLGSISLGSPVFYRDLDVGSVLGWDIGEMAKSVTIRAFVRAPFDSYVHDDTRFWDASGVSVKLGSQGVELQVQSLRALLLGGIAFEAPEQSETVVPSEAMHVFPLFANKEAALAASYTRKIPVISYFPGSVSGLGPGSAVTMHGLPVGHVTDVRLKYDPRTDSIVAPVRFEIEPERILGVGAKSIFTTMEEGAAAMLKRGLRASLESANLITGQQVVALEFDPTAEPVPVTKEGEDFVLPVTSGGSFAGLQAAASELLGKLNQVPFKQIGDNLNGILKAGDDVANGPQLQKTLTDLSAAVVNADALIKNLNAGLTPAMRQVPQIATELQRTLASTNKSLESFTSGYGDDTKFSRDLERLMVQLNDAVRSLRMLSDLLTQHPEVLIRGRPDGGSP